MLKKVTVKYKDGRTKIYKKGHQYEIGYYFVARHQFELDEIESIVLRCYPLKNHTDEILYQSGVEMSDELKDYIYRHRIITSRCNIKLDKK